MSVIYRCDVCKKEYYYEPDYRKHEDISRTLTNIYKNEGIQKTIIQLEDQNYMIGINTYDFSDIYQHLLLIMADKDKKIFINHFSEKETIYNNIFKNQPEFKEYFSCCMNEKNFLINLYEKYALNKNTFKLIQIKNIMPERKDNSYVALIVENNDPVIIGTAFNKF